MAINLKSVLLLACLGVFMLVVAGNGEFIVKGNDVDATFNEHPGEVVLAAAEEIRLLPGFHAREGSEFRAFIDPSISCNAGPLMAMHNDVPETNRLSYTKCCGGSYCARQGAYPTMKSVCIGWLEWPGTDTLIVKQGDTVVLKGEICGCGLTDFWWYKNDTLLASGYDYINGSNFTTLTAVSEGAYGCRLSNTDGSGSFGTIVVLFDNSTGVNGKQSTVSLLISPNPSPSIFNVRIASSGDIPKIVQVTNTLGQVIHSMPIDIKQHNPSMSIDLSGRPEGIYLLTVLSGNRPLAWKKLVLVR